jgi:beta-lactamase class A
MPRIKTADMKFFVPLQPMLAMVAVTLALACFPLKAAAGNDPAVKKTHAALQGQLDALAARARPGTLGISVLDLRSSEQWHVNGGQAYPMMSVFKAPVGAAVLAQIEHGDLSFDRTINIARADLESGPIRDHFRGDTMTFTVRQLLAAAVSKSDNTAVDALIGLVGGPHVVTTFLRAHGIEGMRVDMGEAGNGRVFENLGPSGQIPADETPAEEDRRLQAGYKAYLADPRNRSTPEAATLFLRKLWGNELVSPASTRYLIHLMEGQTVPSRLRAGLPANVRLADKCGTSYTLDGVTAAYNDIGILTWPDGHTVIVAAFLTAAPASQAQRDAIFAELGRDIATTLHP